MVGRKVLKIRRLIVDPNKPSVNISSEPDGVSEQIDNDEPAVAIDDNGDGGKSIIEEYDPSSHADSGGSDSGSESGGKRKRGRPRGSKNGNTSSADKKSKTQNLEALLHAACQMGASFTHVPEFELSHEESKAITEAVTEVAALYDAPMISPEVLAWGRLIFVLGTVTAPRVGAYSLRKRKERAEQKKPQPVIQPSNLVGINHAPVTEVLN